MTKESDSKQQRLLYGWFSKGLGNAVCKQEYRHIKRMLADLFGYHLLQIGLYYDRDIHRSSRIGHHVIISQGVNRGLNNVPSDGAIKASVQGESDQLPVRSDSIDVVVLPHTLDFDPNPHQILREVERVLIAEGRVLIIGFNPWSLWGLWRLCLFWKKEPPWNGTFIRLLRLKDWLKLLGFEVEKVRRLYFRPPIEHRLVLNKLAFLEFIGWRLWPFFSGVYIVQARKKMSTLTPLRPSWHLGPKVVAGVAESGVQRGREDGKY